MQFIIYLGSTEIEIIMQCYEDLAEAISSDLPYYSKQFIECDFIAPATVQFICKAIENDEGDKSVALLDEVIHSLKIAEHKKESFEKFVTIFSKCDRHSHIAQNLTEKYGKCNYDYNKKLYKIGLFFHRK